MNDDLSASQAAKMAGCAPSTMRRWLKEKRISGARLASQGWIVNEKSLREFLGSSAPLTAQSRSEQAQRASSDLVELLNEQLEALREQARFERERATRFEEENRQLHAEIRALLDPKTKSRLGQFVSRWVRI